MFLSIKNTKGFPETEIAQISEWVMSPDFVKLVELDFSRKDEDHVRSIYSIPTHGAFEDKLFAICASSFPISSTDFETLHLSSIENYGGHLHMYQLGLEANKNSVIYWIVSSQTAYTLSTGLGLFLVNTKDQTEPTVYSRMDNLWIAGNAGSTILSIDYGSSHLVT